MKTYLWIIATAYSKIIKIIRGIKLIRYRLGIFSEISLNNVKRRWPAIILAASRTDRVIGRIMFLVVSIITIKEANIIGVPLGTKWENILFVLLIQPKILNNNHIGRAIDIVKVRCLVAVKI